MRLALTKDNRAAVFDVPSEFVKVGAQNRELILVTTGAVLFSSGAFSKLDPQCDVLFSHR